MTAALIVAVMCPAGLASHQRAEPLGSTVERFIAERVDWRQLELAKALASRGDRQVLVALEPVLRHEDRHVRANAAYVFASFGDRRGLAALAGILADRSARPLGQGIPTAIKDPAPRSWLPFQIRADRYYAVHVLGEVADRRGVDLLLPLLEDEDVNYKVAWALGRIGDRRAIPPLIRALDDRAALMRISAIQALEVLGAVEAVPKLRALQTDRALPSAGDRVPVGDVAKAAIARLTARP